MVTAMFLSHPKVSHVAAVLENDCQIEAAVLANGSQVPLFPVLCMYKHSHQTPGEIGHELQVTIIWSLWSCLEAGI